jgi:hypothetical protein
MSFKSDSTEVLKSAQAGLLLNVMQNYFQTLSFILSLCSCCFYSSNRRLSGSCRHGDRVERHLLRENLQQTKQQFGARSPLQSHWTSSKLLAKILTICFPTFLFYCVINIS